MLGPSLRIKKKIRVPSLGVYPVHLFLATGADTLIFLHT